MIAIEFKTGSDTVLFRSSEYSGYELCFQRVKKGEQVWTPEKFYRSIDQGLQAVMELKVRGGEVATLAELKQAIVQARADIVDTWRLRPDGHACADPGGCKCKTAPHV